MKKIFVLLVFIWLGTISHAQNYVNWGDKKYIATATYKFCITGGGGMWDFYLNVTLCNVGDGGAYMLLETGTASKENYFSGTVTIYLENSMQLSCDDQNIRDYVEQKSRALYYINSDQIYHLKESNITRIKFTLNPEWDG